MKRDCVSKTPSIMFCSLCPSLQTEHSFVVHCSHGTTNKTMFALIALLWSAMVKP